MRNKRLIVIFCILGFLTFVAIFSSVLFSVRTVDAYCYNVKNPTQSYDDVLASHGVKKSVSIFSVNKSKVIKNIESKVANVKVINVEKRFPNRITINYVEIKPYVAVEYNAQTYVLSNDGKIVRIINGTDDADDYVKLVLPQEVTPSGLNEGDRLLGEQSQMSKNLDTAFDAIERLGYYNDVQSLIESIDFTAQTFITLKIRSGQTWKIYGFDSLTEKLRMAYSAFLQLSDAQQKIGTLTVTMGDKLKADYSGS